MRATILILAALSLVALVQPAVAQLQSPTGTVADPIKPKPPLMLTDAQRAKVVDAVSKEDTLVKLPGGSSRRSAPRCRIRRSSLGTRCRVRSSTRCRSSSSITTRACQTAC